MQDVAALTACACDDHDLDPLGDVLRGRSSALARLVIRMRMYGHEAEGVSHVPSLPKPQWDHAEPLP